MFYDVFSELCKKRGISDTAAIQAINLSTGNLKNWKNGRTPKPEILKKVADYFNVSVDYLLGKTDVKNDDEKSTVTDDDIKFALFGEVADKIPDEKLQEVKNFAQFIKDNFKKG